MAHRQLLVGVSASRAKWWGCRETWAPIVRSTSQDTGARLGVSCRAVAASWLMSITLPVHFFRPPTSLLQNHVSYAKVLPN